MKKLLLHLKNYRKESILAPLFKMAEAFLELLVPLAVAAMVDRGIGGGDENALFSFGGLLLLLGFVGLLFSVSAQYFAARAAVGFGTSLRSALFAHFFRFSFEELDEIGEATVITRMTDDMNKLQNGVNMFLRLVLRSPLVVIGATVMAFTIDGEVALIFLIAVILLFACVFAVMALSMPHFRSAQEKTDAFVSLLRENLSGARVVRAFCREEEEKDAFSARTSVLRKAQCRAGSLSSVTNPLCYVLLNFAVVLLLYTGALRVEGGVLTAGLVLALYNYMSQILVELIKFANLVVLMSRSIASGKRVAALLSLPESKKEEAKEVQAVKNAPLLSFAGVSFSYPHAGDFALNGVSFAVQKGETVGIIGGTGAGKSTLVSLVSRFYDATQGAVLLDGVNIKDYPLSSLRRRIGFVPQKAFLFAGTVRDNMKMGKEDATDEEIWEALSAAQADGFIREKGCGLDFQIETGGANLSGGQKQRLTVARALVRKPDLLVLDDSSSALDYATDAALRRSLSSLSYRPTVFLVSQRISSLGGADRILVLDDGCLVAEGKHDALLQTSPLYREIYDSQYRKEAANEN